MSEYRGSEWHSWNMHIHTPKTKLNNNFKGFEEIKIWENYATSLNNAGFDAYGITDYFSAENYKYLKKERDNLGLDPKIKLFPNIELRIKDLKPKAKKSPNVNLHVIFSDEVTDRELENFLRNITVGEHPKMNFFDDLSSILCDKVFKHLPNSTDVLTALEKTFGNQKKYLIMVPNGNDGICPNEDFSSYNDNNIFFKEVDLIQSSNEKDFKFFTEQAMTEGYPKNFPVVTGCDAHSLQDIGKISNDRYTWINSELSFEGLKSTIYEPVSRIIISNESPAKKNSNNLNYIKFNDCEEFSEKTLYFNDNLNTIIGSRSSGKSLLLAIIAKKCKPEFKSKVKNLEYDAYVSNLIKKVTLVSKSNIDIDGGVNIDYYSQGELNEIASDRTRTSEFISNIIKSDESNDTLDRFNKYLHEVTNENRNINIKLKELNEELERISGEKKELDDIKNLEKNLEFEQNQLSNVEITPKERAEFIKKCNEQNEINKKLESQIELLNKMNSTEMLKIINEQEKIIVELNNDEIKQKITSLLQEKNKEMKKEIHAMIIEQQNEKKLKEEEIKNLKSNELYEKINSTKNDKLIFNNIAKLNSEIERIKALNVKEEQNNNEKSKLLDIIFSENKIEQAENILLNYKFDNSKDSNIEIGCKFIINREKIKQTCDDMLMRNRTANSNIFKKLDSDNFEKNEYLDLIKSIKNAPNLEFKSNSNYIDFISNITDLEKNVKSELQIIYDGNDFSTSSEGKKAFILLLLEMKFSNKTYPILIDQPEDDLDNRSIYNDLVSNLKKIKLTRQVFIVTHNANIVVGCDSENIIIANQNSGEYRNIQSRKFQYDNTSLENTLNTICSYNNFNAKEIICELLEGGVNAFKERENKYFN